MRVILSVLLLFFLIHISFAQQWKLGVGAGYDGGYSPNATGLLFVQGQDSVLLFARRSHRPGWRSVIASDVNLRIYVERVLLDRDRYQVSTSLSYYKRYSDINSVRINRGRVWSGGVIPATNATFLFQFRGGFKLFRKLVLSTGLGFGIHFRGKVFLGGDPDYPLSNEVYEKSQHIHRTLSFNYHFGLGYSIFRRIELAIFTDESLGRIDRDINIGGSTYSFPLKWRAVGATIAYQFGY